MDKTIVQWSRDYGNGIFLGDGTKIASNVGTVTIPVAFMEAHYAGLPQFSYSPDFTSYTPLSGYSLHKGKYYNKKITLTDAAADFEAANIAAGFERKPDEYTWHHLFDEDGHPNTLQLVNTRIHQRSCPHVGGNKQHYYQSNDSALSPRVALDNTLWQKKNGTVADLLKKVKRFEESPLREFYRQGEKTLLSCQMLFSGERADELVKGDYLWEGSPLDKFPGLQPVGLDCGGNVLLADAEDKMYLLNHETNEIENVDEALSCKEFLCTMKGLPVDSL